MRNHHYALGAALLFTLALPWTLAAAADPNAPIDMQAVQLQPQEQNGVRYLQGGIGQDEANALRKTKGYDLHVELSTGAQGKFQSGASVDIQSAQGQPVLSVTDVGPLLFVQLPPGHYKVTGNAEGETVQQQVVVDGKAPATVNLHWR
ncbi:carboxypeptidase regulatory-like domain-containing protein [Pseudomonas sp. SWRI59]|uniref:carboxypeptidase regulatory-like domain-containing protein n=1 Tax=Pseudomonas TaxID=286 RepID=UPI0016456140|nr:MULTISPECIES: carboxypeptidase regulatory-like domain-containing protein [unclassified Pseudomonas]MBC3483915.1 carboxypeptidase regulatory-like domain-containing protein [Pseudomonas sp. SWRI77]MBC3502485.1 carboxypeptidase regulatory-like domain-containing protein [Pseudomonas sp. SWRI59]MBC3508420.1 carboxypeptidase regulatory-like domain-containing protein [Pseudomonas sp. SWRI68]UVL06263.1 carboxypeptidase-like regulatory domain-containing protein [Pseudomonas sp. B21-047]